LTVERWFEALLCRSRLTVVAHMVEVTSALDLLSLGLGIALVSAAVMLTHRSDDSGGPKTRTEEHP
jgi:hypothetical protein